MKNQSSAPSTPSTEQIFTLVVENDYNHKSFFCDGLEFSPHDDTISVLMSGKNDTVSLEYSIVRDELEAILADNGMNLHEVDKEDDLLYEFYFNLSSKYERANIHKDLIKHMIASVINVGEGVAA